MLFWLMQFEIPEFVQANENLLRTPAFLGSTQVLAVQPWHTGCLLYLAGPASSFFLL
jgi:hypothetical protein